MATAAERRRRSQTYKMFKLVEDAGVKGDEQPTFDEMGHKQWAEKIWLGIKPFVSLQNGIVHYVAPPLEG